MFTSLKKQLILLFFSFFFFFFFLSLFRLPQFLFCSAGNDTCQKLLIKDKVKSLLVQNFPQEWILKSWPMSQLSIGILKRWVSHTFSLGASVWSADNVLGRIRIQKPKADKYHFKTTNLNETLAFWRSSQDVLALACLNNSSLRHTCFSHQRPALQQMAKIWHPELS